MNRKTDMTSERMFLGAFVKAYSRPEMEAKISLRAIRMYLEEPRNMGLVRQPRSLKSKNGPYLRASLNPNVEMGNVGARTSTGTTWTCLLKDDNNELWGTINELKEKIIPCKCNVEGRQPMPSLLLHSRNQEKSS
jgi:hypothetical protein